MADTVASVIAQSRRERSFSRFRFPEAGYAHSIVLQFQEYTYEASGAGLVTPTNNTGSAIVLPLPTNIRDSYSVDVGKSELGTIGALAADATNTSLGALGAELTQATSNIAGQANNFDVNSFLSNTGNATKYFARSAMSSLPGGDQISNAIGITSGTAINPHTVIAFNGVNLKNHQFTWTLSPKNAREAEIINNIIKKIRERMLPSYRSVTGGTGTGATLTLSRGLLQYPDLVNISFVGIDPRYYFFFKPAMIKDFNVDFSPNGMAINRGGKPSTVTISMSLEEARIHTREDVNGAFGDSSEIVTEFNSPEPRQPSATSPGDIGDGLRGN